MKIVFNLLIIKLQHKILAMIAITGATGHLGQSIIRQLKMQEKPVTAVLRKTSDKSLVKDYSESIAEASLENVDSLSKAFDGAEIVIHAAALIDIRKNHLPILRRVNTEGTRNVVAACIKAKVKRLIYISSIEAIDMSKKHRPIREDFGFAKNNAVMDYGDTKADASRIVQAAGFQGKLETILICPTGLIGPWDFHKGLFTSMIASYLKKKLPALIPGGFDFVDVRDVAGAIITSFTKGRSGDVFLTSGNYLEVRTLLEMLQEESGIRAPRLTLHPGLAAMIAKIMEDSANLFNAQVPITRGSHAMLNKNTHCDSSKALAELGFKSRPARETLTDLLQWFNNPADEAIDPGPFTG